MSSVKPQSAPRTLGPAGVTAEPRAARGIVLYIGLDELKAAEDGTNLVEVAQHLQEYVKHLASQAESQAVIALAPEGLGTDLEAVRAVREGSPTATGTPAGKHGPVRTRMPARIHPPLPAEAVAASPAAVDARLKIDIPRREVHVDGALASVTTKEFDLLATLVTHAGQTLSRADLIDALWVAGGEAPDERTVDVHVRRLRKRLGQYSSIVRTIRGGGYRYDEHPDVAVWTATARG